MQVGNAPCSWGVEFPDHPSNPPWRTLLDETQQTGYAGTELGPVGYLPEDPARIARNLAERGLELTAGVLYQPLHDKSSWNVALDALHRTCRMMTGLKARHLVVIDAVSRSRSRWAGSPANAPRLELRELAGLHGRLRQVAAIAREEYGLLASLHAHAGGCIEFEDELEAALDAVDERLLGVCLDTGHSLYSGFDPVASLRRYAERVRYIHLKDLDQSVLDRCVKERIGFYEACDRGVFCRLGHGSVDFGALREAIEDVGYADWMTVEQDRGPSNLSSAADDAAANLAYLRTVGMAR